MGWEGDGDVGAGPPSQPEPPPPAETSLPSQPSAAGVPGNDLYYMLCGGHVLCYEAVFNLCALNGGWGGGALCESLRSTGLKRSAWSGADEEGAGPERNM